MVPLLRLCLNILSCYSSNEQHNHNHRFLDRETNCAHKTKLDNPQPWISNTLKNHGYESSHKHIKVQITRVVYRKALADLDLNSAINHQKIEVDLKHKPWKLERCNWSIYIGIEDQIGVCEVQDEGGKWKGGTVALGY